MSNYTIIPQTIDINTIVDDETLKVVSGKIELNSELKKQFYKEIYNYEFNGSITGTNITLSGLPAVPDIDTNKKYMIYLESIDFTSNAEALAFFESSTIAGQFRSSFTDSSTRRRTAAQLTDSFLTILGNVYFLPGKHTGIDLYWSRFGWWSSGTNDLAIRINPEGTLTRIKFKIYEMMI